MFQLIHLKIYTTLPIFELKIALKITFKIKKKIWVDAEVNVNLTNISKDFNRLLLNGLNLI